MTLTPYSNTHNSAALGLDLEDGENIAALSYKPYASLGRLFTAGVEALQVSSVEGIYGQSTWGMGGGCYCLDQSTTGWLIERRNGTTTD